MIVVAAMIEIGFANLILAEHCIIGTRGWPALRIDVRDDATTVDEHDVDGRLTQIWLRRFHRRPTDDDVLRSNHRAANRPFGLELAQGCYITQTASSDRL